MYVAENIDALGEVHLWRPGSLPGGPVFRFKLSEWNRHIKGLYKHVAGADASARWTAAVANVDYSRMAFAHGACCVLRVATRDFFQHMRRDRRCEVVRLGDSQGVALVLHKRAMHAAGWTRSCRA
jgi:hypothetical protein